jgi:hypothetical protein
MRGIGAAAVVAAAAFGAVGCGQGAPGGGERVGESASYVVLDRAAREAGVRLDGVSAADAVLPVELATASRAELIGPSGRVPLELRADEVIYVRGHEARLERGALDVEVARDRVAVLGAEGAASALAEQVGGVVDARDGRFVVVGPEALGGLARAAMPDGLDEVVPVAPGDAAGKPAFDGALEAGLAPDERALLHPAVPAAHANPIDLSAFLAERVAAAPDDLVPGAADCPDPIVGTWVSREHYPEFGDWYRFELVIRRDARDPARIVGTIGSRSWAGGADLHLPTSCLSPNPEELGVAFDWSVRMDATGAFDGARVSFDGRSHHVETTRCGPQFRADHYNVDHFGGQLVENGRYLQAVNNDGGRAVDEPHVFRRISCR